MPKHMPPTIQQLSKDFPDIEFIASSRFSWHPGQRYVSYASADTTDIRSTWALLHEIGHALLGHADFSSDIALLQMEVDAWIQAHALAKRYGLTIDQDYVEDCTDSYRDWLHLRATCPVCLERCLQSDKHTYRCHNCSAQWHVTRSRLCRPYRRKNKPALIK